MAKICDRCEAKVESAGVLMCTFTTSAEKEIVDLCEKCKEDFFRKLDDFLHPPRALEKHDASPIPA